MTRPRSRCQERAAPEVEAGRSEHIVSTALPTGGPTAATGGERVVSVLPHRPAVICEVSRAAAGFVADEVVSNWLGVGAGRYCLSSDFGWWRFVTSMAAQGTHQISDDQTT